MRKRILIAGYFGYGNVGDEAILQATLEALAAFPAEIEVVVASGDPAVTHAEHGVETVPLLNLDRCSEAIRHVDMVILGGGGLFQDYWETPSSTLLTRHQAGQVAYLGFAYLAKLWEKQLLIHAVGVGPLRTAEGRDQARAAFELADRATVRDRGSLRLLSEMGLGESSGIQLAADPAFLLECEESDQRQAEQLFDELGLSSDERLLVVQLRYWERAGDDESWTAQVAAALDRFLAERPGRVLFLPFQHRGQEHENDCAVALQVIREMSLKQRAVALSQVLPATVVEAVLKRSSLILSMRYHCCLFSLKAGIPTVALAYDPKVEALFEEAGRRRWALSPDRWTADKIQRAMEQVEGAAPPKEASWRKLKRRAETGMAACRELLEQEPQRPSSRAAQRLRRLALDKTHACLDSSPALADSQQAAPRAAVYREQVQEKDEALKDLYLRLEEKSSSKEQLLQLLGDKDKALEELTTRLGEEEKQVQELCALTAERDVALGELKVQWESRGREIAQLREEMGESSVMLAAISEWLGVEGEPRLDVLTSSIEELGESRAQLQSELEDKGSLVARLKVQLDNESFHRKQLSTRLEALKSQTQRGHRFLDHMRNSKRYQLSALAARLRRRPIAGVASLSRWALGHKPEAQLAGVDDYLRMCQLILQGAEPLGHVMIFASVPLDDIGGGQRSAQIARALLRRYCRVTYVYAYPKTEARTGRPVASSVKMANLDHLALDEVTPSELLSAAPPTTMLLFEIPHPGFLPFARLAWDRSLRTVFELIDEWEEGGLWAPWFDSAVQQELADRCTVNVGTARVLVERLRRLGVEQPVYLPNAADERVFDAYVSHSPPVDLPQGYDKILLYFGSLYGEWFGWNFLRAAAERSPRRAFVLIGDDPGSHDMPKNVISLGPKQNEELPAYLAAADAALLPFLPGVITDAVSPVKVFEYLFLEKPVVATEMKELDGLPNVHQAGSPEQFASLCASIPAFSGESEHFISRNTWDSRIDRLLSLPKPRHLFSIVVIMHNNQDVIGRLLDSFLYHLQGVDFEMIVVDNASSDGGGDLVEAGFPTVRLLRNSKNGCSSGRNLGASAASGDMLVFFDSDQWLTSAAWLWEAVHIFDHNPEIGAVGWNAGWFDLSMEHLGGPVVEFMPGRGCRCREVELRGFRTDVGYLATSGFLVPRNVWERLDGFDEYYDPTIFEDTDLSFQIMAEGLSLAFRDLTGIRHQAHQTTGRNLTYEELFSRNSDYFRAKWQKYPLFFRELVEGGN